MTANSLHNSTSKFAAPASPAVERPATGGTSQPPVADTLQQARDAAAQVAYPEPKYSVRDQKLFAAAPFRVTGKTPVAPKVDTSWMADAACAGKHDVLFPMDRPVPPRHERPGVSQRTILDGYLAEARAICAVCPVHVQCAEWATETKPFCGVYDGVLWHRGKPVHRPVRELPASVVYQLKGEVPVRGRPRKTDNVCGTTAGWTRHKRAGEKACTACIAAKQTYERARRKQARRLQLIDGEAS